MPFIQDFLQVNQVNIHLLHFEPFDPATYLDQLTTDEQERFFSFGHINRKMEFVASRVLRHRIFGFEHIHYDEHGAPYINKEGYISISHAEGVVGIALCPHFKVGLDLETIREKAIILSPKFLSPTEANSFDTKSAVEMTKVWSAKEVLYKLAGRKKIIFKEELLLSKSENDTFNGTIINPDHELHVELRVFEKQNTIISVNHKACEKR